MLAIDHIRSIDKSRIGVKDGKLNNSQIEEVKTLLSKILIQ